MKIWVRCRCVSAGDQGDSVQSGRVNGKIVVLESPIRPCVLLSPVIKMLQVARGFDVADAEIIKRLEAGDLVITSDIPLAADARKRWTCARSTG